jgi:hypothetical protein
MRRPGPGSARRSITRSRLIRPGRSRGPRLAHATRPDLDRLERPALRLGPVSLAGGRDFRAERTRRKNAKSAPGSPPKQGAAVEPPLMQPIAAPLWRRAPHSASAPAGTSQPAASQPTRHLRLKREMQRADVGLAATEGKAFALNARTQARRTYEARRSIDRAWRGRRRRESGEGGGLPAPHGRGWPEGKDEGLLHILL